MNYLPKYEKVPHTSGQGSAHDDSSDSAGVSVKVPHVKSPSGAPSVAERVLHAADTSANGSNLDGSGSHYNGSANRSPSISSLATSGGQGRIADAQAQSVKNENSNVVHDASTPSSSVTSSSEHHKPSLLSDVESKNSANIPPTSEGSASEPSSQSQASHAAESSSGSKLSINSIVASQTSNNDAPGQLLDSSLPSNSTQDPPSRENASHTGETDSPIDPEDSDASMSDSEVAFGALPSSFRSISKGFKHLKKGDGEPFWRKDIQYDFLNELFTNEMRVFTNSFPHCEIPNAVNDSKLTFSELYVRTLAESSKSSKVLRERLIKDPDMAIAVSKVCLLVNAGRMNTTINFVPDMRSALRTYHSIPSLQADPYGPSKPLQDTPRLKTILKAVCEGQSHWQNLLDILRDPPATKPNTNVIKLIFLMSTFFQSIPFHYNDANTTESFAEKLRFVRASPGPQNKFMEFFLDEHIHPKNRARRFLWLMYTYLETSFTDEELAKNPFNPHKIPDLEYIAEAELGSFDQDPEYEVNFAIKMYHTRMLHLDDEVNNTNPKRGNKSKRERQKIRRQLIMDHSYGPNHALIEDDYDDSLVGDYTQNEDGDDGDEHENANEIARSTFIQKFILDRHKRKKPTPSVGSLVDDSKRTIYVGAKWTNPEFPVPHLKRACKRFTSSTGIPYKALNKDSESSVSKRRNEIFRTKNLTAYMAKNVPDYEKRRQDVMHWIDQYFQYKKSAGLLEMEWEDIRNDLVNGVETFLYQQLGKSLIKQHHEEQVEEERQEQGEPELLKKEEFLTSPASLPGDSAPVDLSGIENLGSGFVPCRDFDNANERTTFEFSMIRLADMIFSQNPALRTPTSNYVHFDLDSEHPELSWSSG